MHIPKASSSLSALLGGIDSTGRLVHIPTDTVVRNESQPRTQFDPDALSALAASISQQGVIQPIVVRELPDGRFEVVAGERRWLASRQAGLRTVPAIVHDVSDRESLTLALAENLVRENLNPVETARAYAALVDQYEMPVAELARAVGKSRPAVANTLRLLELPDDVLNLVETRQITEGHARTLLQVDDRLLQRRMARQVVAEALSVRALEAVVKKVLQSGSAAPRPSKSKWNGQASPELQEQVERIAERMLGIRGKVKVGERGGKLELVCSSMDELASVLERLESALSATA
jgi:ParB family chromosome partitioning protein